jgi:hypothetical protein
MTNPIPNQTGGILACAVLFIAGLLLPAVPLRAQPALQITSPANGAAVEPGQTLNITVAASGATFQMVVVLGTKPLGTSQGLAAPPYQFSIQVPTNIPLGTYYLTAEGVIGPGQGVYSGQISVNVVEGGTPTLTSAPSIMNLAFVGDQAPLQITGTFPTGSALDVTKASNTTYVSGSPSIATVSTYGMVTATGPGSTYITVNNTLYVPVNVPPPISVVPPISILYANQTQQFTATLAVPPPPGSVTWSPSPSGVGTLSNSGFYTAPSQISAQQVVTITAAISANGPQSASASLLLYPPLTVNVAPATATLGQSQTQQFTATVANVSSGNMAVAWSTNPNGVGTVGNTGLYTAPASITSTQTVSVIATSVADGVTTGSASVTLTPPQ